jgi:hypothetical protein
VERSVVDAFVDFVIRWSGTGRLTAEAVAEPETSGRRLASGAFAGSETWDFVDFFQNEALKRRFAFSPAMLLTVEQGSWESGRVQRMRIQARGPESHHPLKNATNKKA